MIPDERRYLIVKDRINDFKAVLVILKSNRPPQDDQAKKLEYAFYMSVIRSQLDDLYDELKEYESKNQN